MIDRHVDHLIIGGGIAGATAAEAIRERDARASILVVGDEREVTYSRVMMPHVVRGKTPEERVFLRTHEGFAAKRIGFETGKRVARVDAALHEAHFTDGSVVLFGKLLIATGGYSRGLDCPGGDSPVCLPFQTIDDTRRLIEHRGDKRAVVVGGGFIAMELLMSFASFGAETTAVVRGEGFFGKTIGAAGRARIDAAVAAAGVKRLYGETVKEVVSADSGVTVRLGSGSEIAADAVGVGVGIVRNVQFLSTDGPITLSADGVVVNEHLETSVPGIFSAGDVAAYFDVRTGRHRAAGNWQNAMFQGKIAGANMAGEPTPFTMVTTYSITCFGLPVIFSGATDGADERIERVTPAAVVEWYIEKGKVVGAVIIGVTPERAQVQRILGAGVVVTDAVRAMLGDSSADLSGV